MEGLEPIEIGAAIGRAKTIEEDAASMAVADIQASEEERAKAVTAAVEAAAAAAAAAIDWGVPALVGRDEPLPLEIPMTRDGKRKATFYLRRSWDVLLMIEMDEAGVPSEINITPTDPGDPRAWLDVNRRVIAQNRFCAVHLLDEKHAWDPFERDDGSVWTYRPPAPEEIGTAKDDRVRLASGLIRQFGNLKSKAFILGMGIREVAEENSETSSGPAAVATVAASVPATSQPS